MFITPFDIAIYIRYLNQSPPPGNGGGLFLRVEFQHWSEVLEFREAGWGVGGEGFINLFQ